MLLHFSDHNIKDMIATMCRFFHKLPTTLALKNIVKGTCVSVVSVFQVKVEIP